MSEKKYLKWYQKVAYGSGDLASNCSYALISSFMMIYLTNTVGLNSAVIGTLMMISKLLDGITDIFFGALIDRTKSKLGKARPWMLYSQIGVSACLFLVFCIPSMSQNMQYVYFFVFYTAFNAIFYTASNISYASLTALITKNPNERVQLGSFRFMFALLTNIIVASVAMGMVESFGGGAKGWRMLALIFAIIGLVVNTFSVLMVKEVPEDSFEQGTTAKMDEVKKVNVLESLKLLIKNKYYIIILGIYIAMYGASGVSQGVGIYFMTYYMGNPALLGTFSMASMLPMIIGLAITPALVKKLGSMWKVNLYGYLLNIFFGVFFIIAALNKNLPIMLIIAFIRGLGSAPMTGTLNALIAEVSGYTKRTQKQSVDGTMYSCSSLGIKLGSGIGSAVAGWLLAIGGFNGMAEVQTQSAVNMIFIMYAVIPLGLSVVITILNYLMKVEKANREWDAAHSVSERSYG